ncbi:MAG: glycosyltransferase [Myxococcales bacterium]|nr:glycosyltransferase [Myxococcales bacterium]
MDLASIALAVCLLWALWALGYPLISRWLPVTPVVADGSAPDGSHATVVVVAHNAAVTIAARIANLLAQEWPEPSRLQVLVASDGSTDATVAIARSFGSDRVQVLDLQRCGKSEATNRAVAATPADVLLFTDATTRWDLSAAAELMAALRQPAIGAASGIVRYELDRPESAIGRAFVLYNRYARWIRTADDHANQASVSGACHAMLRRCWSPLAGEETADLLVPAMAAADNKRTVLAHRALAFEATRSTLRGELRARERICTRAFASLPRLLRTLLRSGHGADLARTLAHKVPRWLIWCPGLAAVAGALVGEPGWPRVTLRVAMAAWAAALLHAWLLRDRANTVSHAASYLALAMAASLIALCKRLAGQSVGKWTP